MQAHLRMYGEIGWLIDGRVEPISGAVRRALLLMLAEQRGDVVSVDTLIDRLWAEPPRSGANAVQRHVSLLRRTHRELGLGTDLIESVAGGYRLHSGVSTDLHQLEKDLDAGSILESDVPWSLRPLVASDFGPNDSLRHRLERLADRALDQLHELRPTPGDDVVDAHLRAMRRHADGRATVDRIVRARRSALDVVEPLTPGRHHVQTVRRVIAHWLAGEGDVAFDLLDGADDLPADFARRLYRWLVWLDPDEGFVRSELPILVEEMLGNPLYVERSIASIDAWALAHTANAPGEADREVARMPAGLLRLRALRVAFMLCTPEPPSDREDDLVAQIAATDLNEAQLDAHRYRFVTMLRRCDYTAAAEALDEYDSNVAAANSGIQDDFAPMIRAAMQHSVDPDVRQAFGPSEPALRSFASDRWVVPSAVAIRRLVGDESAPTLSDSEFFAAVESVGRPATSGFRLLRAIRSAEDFEPTAHALMANLSEWSHSRHFLLLPIALTIAAEQLGDREMANALTQVLRPWSGYSLGMWLAEYNFGPADAWLDRLAAV